MLVTPRRRQVPLGSRVYFAEAGWSSPGSGAAPSHGGGSKSAPGGEGDHPALLLLRECLPWRRRTFPLGLVLGLSPTPSNSPPP
jgi:hypothetical protein